MSRFTLLFDHASRLARRGEYKESAVAYERFLTEVAASATTVDVVLHSFMMKYGSVQCAEIYNLLDRFEEALERAKVCLSLSPLPRFKSRALSEKAEALHGLGRTEEAQAAFGEAIVAHSVTGRVEFADWLMRRFGTATALDRAEQMLAEAEDLLVSDPPSFSVMAVRTKSELSNELYVVRSKVAQRRGDTSGADLWRQKAHEARHIPRRKSRRHAEAAIT